jgi:hypothetical protein
MLKYFLALGLVGVVAVSTGSHEARCTTEAQRGQAAVQFARALNVESSLRSLRFLRSSSV